jgi:hypothetical protein
MNNLRTLLFLLPNNPTLKRTVQYLDISNTQITHEFANDICTKYDTNVEFHAH